MRKKENVKDVKANKSDETEFKCLSKFTPLEEFVYELEHNVGGTNDVKDVKEEKKSEWYKYIEEKMQEKSSKGKEMEEASFDDLLGYWMKQGI